VSAQELPLQKTLPSNWYFDADIFRREQERIFWREWMCVAREEELPSAGDYRVIDLSGQSILLVRNRQGQLKAFYNVCRHRGAQLCRTDGTEPVGMAVRGGISGGRIVCPYHQWTYDLDGRLVAAPHMADVPGFDKSSVQLYGVGVESWGGFVFVSLAPNSSPTFASQMAEIAERTRRYPLDKLRIGHTIHYRVAANWKSICENYNECYHCGGVHPELCSVVPAFKEAGGAGLDWNRGIPHRDGAYTFSFSGTTSRRPFPGLNEDEKTRHKGEVIYPNLFVSLACDHAAVFVLKPVDAERTDITCHFLFEPEEIAKPGFEAKDTVEFWDVTNRQDWAICESVQRGMHALVHNHGYYAPMEDISLDIRRYVRERLGEKA
jgi:Rieske 2Fe-2S family protein